MQRLVRPHENFCVQRMEDPKKLIDSDCPGSRFDGRDSNLTHSYQASQLGLTQSPQFPERFEMLTQLGGEVDLSFHGYHRTIMK
jgi:hypothetical protein